MDRVSDDASDVAVADSRVGREGDTLYRRPPAQPPAEATTGGSWFTDSTELPAVDEPMDGSPAAAPSRVSFGFTSEPISPVRHTSAPPASPASSSPDTDPIGPPVRRQITLPPADAPAAPGWPPPPRLAPESSGALRGSSGANGALRGSPGANGALRGSSGANGALRGSSGANGALRGSSGANGALRDSSGANRAVRGSSGANRALRGSSGAHEALRGSSGANGALRESSGASRELRGSSGSSEDLRAPSGERRVARADPPAAPRRQSRGVTVGMVILSLIVLVGGSVMGVVYFSGSDDGLDSVLQLGAGDSAKRTVTAPLDNRTKASFELLAGANTVRLTIGELGDDLYRISTPDDAGILPSPILRDDDLKLQVDKDGDGTGGEIEIVLSAKVRWQLRFSGYAEKQLIDVTGGQVSGIEMVAGTREAAITLPSASGTVPLKINGAVEKLTLTSPADNPVRIKVGGGAQTVVAGTRTLTDVAPGSTLTPKGWNTTDRYDVTAGARITSLTVENAA